MKDTLVNKIQIGRHFRKTPIALPRRICQSSIDVANKIGQERVSFSDVIVVAERTILVINPITRKIKVYTT